MENPLCKYKNLFGEAGSTTGFRKYRIIGISIIDVVVTVLFGFIISYYYGFNIWITLGTLFIVGIIVHHLFCVRTTVDKFIFG